MATCPILLLIEAWDNEPSLVKSLSIFSSNYPHLVGPVYYFSIKETEKIRAVLKQSTPLIIVEVNNVPNEGLMVAKKIGVDFETKINQILLCFSDDYSTDQNRLIDPDRTIRVLNHFTKTKNNLFSFTHNKNVWQAIDCFLDDYSNLSKP